MQVLIQLVSLVLLLISVICIYSARSIIKNRIEVKDQNKVVLGMKIVFTIIACISLFCLYLFKG